MDILLISMLIIGILLGFGLATIIDVLRGNNATERTRTALRDITNHQWGTGKHNDAVVITRMALRGLDVK